MQVFLTVDVDGEKVTPSVGVMSSGPARSRGESAAYRQPDMDTVRLGAAITNQVLDFAERIKRG